MPRNRAWYRRRAARSRLAPLDLGAEAAAGILQRPGRSALTILGTLLGTGTVVAVIGLAATGDGQLAKELAVPAATRVTVTDAGAGDAAGRAYDFPPAADAAAARIGGVAAAGVWWQVPLTGVDVGSLPGPRPAGRQALPVYAASAGMLRASGASVAGGVWFSRFHETARQDVAVLSAAAAAHLGIWDLARQPAIFIAGRPFTVIGIIRAGRRLPLLGRGVIVPVSTALSAWGPPEPARPAQMLIRTRPGAAQAVARQAAVAMRPDDPALLSAAAPARPALLRRTAGASLRAVFLMVAAVAAVAGAAGIAAISLAAITGREPEIGLRRALGARPAHIAAQFLAESAALGLLGGLAGTAAGLLATLGVSAAHHWTAVMVPGVMIVAPLAGAVTGLLAGLYPALRASTVEPADALRG